MLLQLRANCSSNQPGWKAYVPQAPPSTLSGLQIGLVVSAVCFVAATVALLAVLVLRRRDQWESLDDDAEMAEVSWQRR